MPLAKHLATLARRLALPRLPLSTLDEVRGQLENWLLPVAGPEKTQAFLAAWDARKPDLEAAHAKLQELYAQSAAQNTSWIEALWLNSYLAEDRITTNYFFALPTSGNGSGLDKAAHLVSRLIDLRHRMVQAPLEPKILGPVTYCRDLTQEHLFAHRLPGKGQDRVQQNLKSPHFCVLSRGHVFKVSIEDATTPEALKQQLLAIDGETADKTPATNGYYFHLPRTEWWPLRDSLLTSKHGPALQTMESALFWVCLDDTPGDASQWLAGPTANRCPRAALSLLVHPNGVAVNVEHSGLDGLSTKLVVGELCATPMDVVSESSTPTALSPITLPDPLDVPADAQPLTLETLTLNLPPTSRELTADACLQLAYALALGKHQLENGTGLDTLGSIYESVTTQHFHHGRTEGLRTVTPEVLSFVTTWLSDSSTDTEKTDCLTSALSSLKARLQTCKEAKGITRPLFGLGQVAPALADLLAHPALQALNTDVLSTSNCTGVPQFGFRPTNPSCVGIGYTVADNKTATLTFSAYPEGTPLLQTLVRRLQGFLDEIGRLRQVSPSFSPDGASPSVAANLPA
ncbi:MAG: choline/carnitine O-acyltransferase [Candidatus Margulisiibacteriota bacterium]